MFSHNNPACVAIVMGSESDWATMQFAAEVPEVLDVLHRVEVVSAHRTPGKLFSFAESARENSCQVIIVGAGGAAHLPGIIAVETLVLVLGMPVQSAALNGVDSLYSIVQVPCGIPVGTLAIGKAGATNTTLLAAQILANHDKELHQRLSNWRKAQADEVLENPDPRGVARNRFASPGTGSQTVHRVRQANRQALLSGRSGWTLSRRRCLFNKA